jgi:hypothetical protein
MTRKLDFSAKSDSGLEPAETRAPPCCNGRIHISQAPDANHRAPEAIRTSPHAIRPLFSAITGRGLAFHRHSHNALSCFVVACDGAIRNWLFRTSKPHVLHPVREQHAHGLGTGTCPALHSERCLALYVEVWPSGVSSLFWLRSVDR